MLQPFLELRCRKIPILLRMLDKKKNKPIGFFIHLCEKCLWGKMIPIWPQDFGMMNFSGKIVHSSCSGKDLDRINQLIEQEIISRSTRTEEIHRSMVDLLTDLVFLSNGSKDNVQLCAVETPPTIFSQEYGDDNSSYQQVLDALALLWTEGNYVDLGIVTENHWAYKLIKQEQEQEQKIDSHGKARTKGISQYFKFYCKTI